jgi:hypothetical protein
MKHIVAGLASLAVLAVVTVATAQTDGWKEYVYTCDGFAIGAPSEPARSSQPIYVTGGTADAHIYTSAAGSNTALMLFVYERHSGDRRSLQQIHAQAQKARSGRSKESCARDRTWHSENIKAPSSSSKPSIPTLIRRRIRCAADIM